MNFLKRISNFFADKNGYVYLPENIKKGLEAAFPEESINYILRDFRAMYFAPSMINNNTFFQSWVVFTEKRILVLRNASSFRLFRNIPYASIEHIQLDPEEKEWKMTIISKIASYIETDIIEFQTGALDQLPIVNQMIKQLPIAK